MEKELSPTELASKAGISVPYASQIISKARTPSRMLAIRIFQRTRMKFPPIEGFSDEDIETLARIEGIAAREAPAQGAAA